MLEKNPFFSRQSSKRVVVVVVVVKFFSSEKKSINVADEGREIICHKFTLIKCREENFECNLGFFKVCVS